MSKMQLNTDWCKGCGYCVSYCPKKAIRPSGNFNSGGYEYVEVDESVCIRCGICYTVCPDCVFEIHKEAAK